MSLKKEYKFMNNTTLTINMGDVDFIERFESAFAHGREKEKCVNPLEPDSVRLRSLIEIYDCLIDELFGDGTSKKLFGGDADYVNRVDVLMQITDICRKQNEELGKKHRAVLDKYRPSGK